MTAIFSLQGRERLEVLGQGTAKTCQITREYLENEFESKDFLGGAFELFKNGRDRGAKGIWVFYDAERGVFQIIDDGEGMNDECQESLGSAGKSNVKDPRKQSAMFGTGFKYFAIGESAQFEVVTLLAGEPNQVQAFSLERIEFIDKLRAQASFAPTLYRRSDQSWPWGNPRVSGLERVIPHGTVFTFQLRPEKRDVHPTQDEFAQQLSNLLPETLRRIIRLNGQSLPEKELTGDFYPIDIDGDPVLGNLHAEFYRPKHQEGFAMDRGILTGPNEIGEVPLGNILRHMKPELRARFPRELRSNPEVCGTISWSKLRDYSVPKRDDYKAELKNESAALARFVRVMQQHLASILERLRIEIPPALLLEDDRHRTVLTQTAARWNKVMDPDGVGPPTQRDELEDEPGDEPDGEGTVCGESIDDGTTNVVPIDPTAQSTQPALSIIGIRRSNEIELGEEFDIEFRVRADLASQIGPEDINLHLARSHCADITPANYPARLRKLRATTLGAGELWIEVPNQSRKAAVNFQVVEERKPRLNKTALTIKVGEEARIALVNPDKLTGKPVWSHDVPGRYEESRDRRVYTVFGQRPAVIAIGCTDADDPAVVLTATIEVRGAQTTDQVCIFGWWFDFDYRPIHGARPVVIDSLPGVAPDKAESQPMRWNALAPGYLEAERGGNAQAYVDLNIGIEWARWCHQQNLDPLTGHPRPRLSIDSRDSGAILVEFQDAACRIFELIHAAAHTS